METELEVRKEMRGELFLGASKERWSWGWSRRVSEWDLSWLEVTAQSFHLVEVEILGFWGWQDNQGM